MYICYISGTSIYDMEATVTSPSGVTELCDLKAVEDGHYSIKFVPKEMGIHTVCVKHKGLHIPGRLHIHTCKVFITHTFSCGDCALQDTQNQLLHSASYFLNSRFLFVMLIAWE